MKLRVEIDGAEYLLESSATLEAGVVEAALKGELSASGVGSIAEISPGLLSVLVGSRSFTVSVTRTGDESSATVRHRSYRVSIADPRDRSAKLKRQAIAGPVELRAQMPGKVIKFLVETGAIVSAGQSLVVVEAMKMQNEMKAPKEGAVSRIFVREGATVAAGEPLLRLE